MIQIQFNAKLQVVRLNNGGEYLKQTVENYFLENEIIHQTSCADTPRRNEVAKRKNRHLLEVARALMFARNILSSFREMQYLQLPTLSIEYPLKA